MLILFRDLTYVTLEIHSLYLCKCMALHVMMLCRYVELELDSNWKCIRDMDVGATEIITLSI